MKKVLVLEDQKYIRDFIFDALHRAGYAPVDEPVPDLVAAVLDVDLKGRDSLELCQSLRCDNEHIAILLLTDRGQAMDQLNGLMTGADEYLTKPFSPASLIGQLEALLGRVHRETVRLEELLTSGPFILDIRRCTLEKFGERIRLTRREYDVVRFMLENPDRDISAEELLSSVWDSEGDARQVDMTVRCLRFKLEDDPNQPVYITTVLGHGYRWCG